MPEERPPVVEQIVIVRHADYRGTFLTEEGKAQCRRLAECLNGVYTGSGNWACFSSCTWRAVETALEVARKLEKTHSLYSSKELYRGNLTRDLELVTDRAQIDSAMLFVGHCDSIVRTMGSILKHFGFDPETHWPWQGEWDAVYPTHGVVINIKTGEVAEISGCAA